MKQISMNQMYNILDAGDLNHKTLRQKETEREKGEGTKRGETENNT